MSTLMVRRSRGLVGQLAVPGDKSTSHRAAILGALAQGDTSISGFLAAEDTLNTARALEAMGVPIEGLGEAEMVVHGVGLRGLREPPGILDMGNSGTGMRLLMGVLAGQDFAATLAGDASLSKRPMDRIARPLSMMGIRVDGQGDNCAPPVTVHGGQPAPIVYYSPVASAQVKSAVLLAGLYTSGTTTLVEPAKSRDHTERMLSAFGASLNVQELQVSVVGGATLNAQPVTVPGDFSSAAYFIAAALLCQGSELKVHDVLLNPTRAALLEVLGKMGANITITGDAVRAGERMGDVVAGASDLAATEVRGEIIPSLLDEIPLLAVVATQAHGVTEIRHAAELRVKESDRLSATARGLQAMGAQIEELPDGLVITGPTQLSGATVDARHDHRIAMSFAVAGLVAHGATRVTGAEYIDTSFPDFAQMMTGLGADVALAP